MLSLSSDNLLTRIVTNTTTDHSTVPGADVLYPMHPVVCQAQMAWKCLFMSTFWRAILTREKVKWTWFLVCGGFIGRSVYCPRLQVSVCSSYDLCHAGWPKIGFLRVDPWHRWSVTAQYLIHKVRNSSSAASQPQSYSFWTSSLQSFFCYRLEQSTIRTHIKLWFSGSRTQHIQTPP